jgi:arginyl-tRNA synthetase
MTPLTDLRHAVLAATVELTGGEQPQGTLTLERPPRPDFGDYSTNAALLLAPVMKQPPRAVAEQLSEQLARELGDSVGKVEVAGPGFLNLFFDDAWFRAGVARVLDVGDRFGAGGATAPEKIDIEFVSTNPTGPLHVAHGRHAAFGDALARILAYHGHAVTREFYVNDFGSQIRRLAESIEAHAHGRPVPEDGYQGDYVAHLVDLEQAREMDLDALGQAAVKACLDMFRATLARFEVHFDVWFSERTLHEGDPSPVDAELAELARRGESYHAEGALWLRTTAHGDDKDRVLERSSGDHTYLASDVAYHQNKLARGFDRLLNVWGADHHGYIGRMKASLAALGEDPDRLELLILQFVHLIEGGDRASMSKRSGEFVTLDDLIAEIGADAARYFLLARSADTTVDLDLDLARAESADNPVFYVQYAHARIASVLDKAGMVRVDGALGDLGWRDGTAALPDLDPAERSLVKAILAFPEEVAEAAARRAPHRIANYALALAQDFTAFYHACQIVGAGTPELESFRIALAVAARNTIASALRLLGVSAPQHMSRDQPS